MRNERAALAVDLDHDDYHGNYYRNNATACGVADRKRAQPDRREPVLATSDRAPGTD
jgi:hypothetical protein